MKLFIGLIATLGLVVLVLAVFLVARPTPSAGCTGRIVIVKGADGEPLECVCAEGALATCFKPGP